MTSTTEVLEKIVELLPQQLDGIATCEEHAGQFSPDDLGRESFKAPALFATCLGGKWGPNIGTEQLVVKAKWLVFVIAESARGGNARRKKAQALAEAVALNVSQNRWGLAGVGSASDVDFENLHSPRLDGKGVALWVVTWNQEVKIGGSIWDGDGVTPTEILVGYEPATGTGNEGEYEQLQP